MNLEAASRVAAECRDIATAINFRAESLKVDVSQEESVARATKYMVDTFERIDYCINCAGVSETSLICYSADRELQCPKALTRWAYLLTDRSPISTGHIGGRL